ncbi:MAG: tetratricopeptide repeat protein [Gemmatimonadales bacterium]
MNATHSGGSGSAGGVLDAVEADARRVQAALAADPENPALLHELGRLFGRLGQDDLELSLIGQAIARRGDDPDYHADLGLALLAAGYRDDARACFEAAFELDPVHSAARWGLADLLLDDGDPAGAAEAAAGCEPTHHRAARVLGRLALAEGRWSDASGHLLEYLGQSPLDAPALFYLGVALQSSGLLEPAVTAYQQAVATDPDLFEAHANLATALTALGRANEALRHAERAVAMAPERPGALLNRANARRDGNDVVGALADLKTAVTLAPGYAEAWSTLGNLYHDLGELSQALEAHDRAVAAAPALAQARWNRSFTLLTTGQLAEGWDEYEWRLQTEAAAPEPRDFLWPRWDGSSPAGKRILVWREQGIGDELLFLTCLGDLFAAGAEVTVLVSPRLAGLTARSFPAATIIPDGQRVDGPFDWQVPIGSLPRVLRRARQAFPRRGDYLVAEAAARTKWAERLAALGPGRRIGLCWRSGLVTAARARHYPPLDELRPLLETPGVVWVNLQYDDCTTELETMKSEWGVTVHSWAGENLRDDLESVAGLIAELDAVVTAPTAVSSLAGALGRPTWQLDSGSDWTVFGEARSPWFPTIRVVAKRPFETDWGRPVAEIRSNLTE